MILDSIKNASAYYRLNTHFKRAFEFLCRSGIPDLEDGRHEIDGDDIFCLISRLQGKKLHEAKLEIHRKYIDIQFIISGEDTMGWKALDECHLVEKEFDAEKDFGLFADQTATWIRVKPGNFAIFFPEDAHAPLVSEGIIHKAIIKVAV